MTDKRVLTRVIDNQSLQAGDRMAVKDACRSITYSELTGYSNGIRNVLLGQGVAKGQVVALFFKKSIAYVLSLLGTNKAGAVFMPLDPDYPVLRNAGLVEATNTAVFLTDEANEPLLLDLLLSPGLPVVARKVLVLQSGWKEVRIISLEGTVTGSSLHAVAGFSEKEVNIDGDDSNYLIYTSGSTGKPKIIEGCHKSLSHFIHWEAAEFSLGRHTRVSQLSAITFDVSFRDIFVPLMAGGTLHIPSPDTHLHPARLLQWLADEKITLIHMVPTLFRALTDELRQHPGAAQTLAHLTQVLLAGEPLYGRDVLNWRQVMAVELVNLYGPSETTLAKIYNRIQELPDDPHAVIPLGKPLPGCKVLIMNDGLLCGTGAIGEICIKTPFRSKGYYKDPVLTSRQFIQNPLHNDYEDIIYKSGDIGKLLPDGLIGFAGRNDRQIKIRGNRVELDEIEAVINQIFPVRQAVVKPFRMGDNDPVLVCYYREHAHVEQGYLQKELEKRLPAAMHPSFFVRMEEFPTTLSGKLDMKSLPVPEKLLYRDTVYVPPATGTEKKLAAIWMQVLGLERIGRDQSFFSVGGHSLSATKIISLIYKAFDRELSLKEFFGHPSIEELANLIQMKAERRFKPVPTAAPAAYYPLSHAQKRIWIAHEKESPVLYNMPASCIISGDIDFKALNKSFQLLIVNHESLRTGFVQADGQVVQKIWEQIDFNIQLPDGNDACIAEEDIGYYYRQELSVPFDLQQPPLLRVTIRNLGRKRYLFLFTIHHIICDGWSLGIILDEVLDYYKAYREGRSVTARSLPVQYKDYTLWYNDLVNAAVNPQRLYWKEQLAEKMDPLHLPVDRALSERREFSGEVVGCLLSRQASDSLRTLAGSHDASLFVILLSALNIVLFKYCGQSDISVGVPVSGRFHADLEMQVGLFLNYLVLRSRLRRSDAYQSYVHQLNGEVVDALSHQMYPYDKMVEEFRGESTHNGRNPFYDVLLVMNNDELNGSQKSLDELTTVLGAEKIPLNNITSKVAFTFFVTDAPEIGINLEYSTALFSKAVACGMLDKLHMLLQLLPGNQSRSLSELSRLLSDSSEQLSGHELAEENEKLINEDF